MHASSHIAKKHIIGSVQIDLRSFYQALTRTNTHEGERGDAGGGREEEEGRGERDQQKVLIFKVRLVYNIP